MDIIYVKGYLGRVSGAWLPSGDGDVEGWKIRIPLVKLLRKDVDGRTVNGLEKLVPRLEADKDKVMQASLCKNYLRLVLAGKVLIEGDLVTMDFKELETQMLILQDEIPGWPINIQSQLLERRCNTQMAEARFQELFHTMNPFAVEAKFDWRAPRLCDLDASSTKKMVTFMDVIMEKLLVQWISKGEEGAGHIADMACVALETYKEVDLVNLDFHSARELTDQVHIWRCCTALLGHELDTSYQAPC